MALDEHAMEKFYYLMYFRKQKKHFLVKTQIMRNIILTDLNFVTAQVLKSLVWEEHWAFLSNVFQITKALK